MYTLLLALPTLALGQMMATIATLVLPPNQATYLGCGTRLPYYLEVTPEHRIEGGNATFKLTPAPRRDAVLHGLRLNITKSCINSAGVTEGLDYEIYFETPSGFRSRNLANLTELWPKTVKEFIYGGASDRLGLDASDWMDATWHFVVFARTIIPSHLNFCTIGIGCGTLTVYWTQGVIPLESTMTTTVATTTVTSTTEATTIVPSTTEATSIVTSTEATTTISTAAAPTTEMIDIGSTTNTIASAQTSGSGSTESSLMIMLLASNQHMDNTTSAIDLGIVEFMISDESTSYIIIGCVLGTIGIISMLAALAYYCVALRRKETKLSDNQLVQQSNIYDKVPPLSPIIYDELLPQPGNQTQYVTSEPPNTIVYDRFVPS